MSSVVFVHAGAVCSSGSRDEVAAMEFRQLEAFRAIAEELHFGRAAERLYLSQPSISQQLQRLEAEVGVRLVHRSSRRVQLTAAGMVFLAEAERVFAAGDRAIQLARQAALGNHGALRISTNYPASRLLLLPLLERLRREDSQLTTVLREMSSPDQGRALLRGDLDLGLVYGPIVEPGLRSRHLLDVPVVAMVRAGHPLADLGVLPFDRIPSYPYLARYTGGSEAIEVALMRTASANGVRLPNGTCIADQHGYLLELETTDAVGFISLPRGEQSAAAGLRLLRLAPVEPTLEIHVAWNPRNDESLVNGVIEQLVELARDL